MIQSRNITVEINSKKLLDNISLEISCGEIHAILGPNGAGKSTLRKVLCGDLMPTKGSVSMDNKPLCDWSLTERAMVRAVLPQDSSLNFPFSVLEVVLMGRAPHIIGTESEKDFQIARSALESVDELKLSERIYSTLSGGEKQRVQLARVLAQIWEKTSNSRYLLLDEPTSNLDLAHQHKTLMIARKFASEGVGVLVIIHDLNLAAQYANRITLLKEGELIISDLPEKVFEADIIYDTFGVSVSVQKHPYFDCPLIIWRDIPENKNY